MVTLENGWKISPCYNWVQLCGLTPSYLAIFFRLTYLVITLREIYYTAHGNKQCTKYYTYACFQYHSFSSLFWIFLQSLSFNSYQNSLMFKLLSIPFSSKITFWNFWWLGIILTHIYWAMIREWKKTYFHSLKPLTNTLLTINPKTPKQNLAYGYSCKNILLSISARLCVSMKEIKIFQPNIIQ
jgi:hypothetical protein